MHHASRDDLGVITGLQVVPVAHDGNWNLLGAISTARATALRRRGFGQGSRAGTGRAYSDSDGDPCNKIVFILQIIQK